ncbi:hypothetical protein [Nocardiopsis lucentensis]|uniref:hypothetical protein n=1 Tax=Nocardiopsis lucentensis TaxID=53441 RepID=UPI000377C9BE|nr:hypothetical protein [Nocardiopsis lucentensis]
MRRFTTRIVVLLAAAASVIALGGAPASAHSLYSAVVSDLGCSWENGNYTILESQPVYVEAPYERVGTVYLLWNAQYQQNCTVARKTGSSHGVPTLTVAYLEVQGLDRYSSKYRDYSHYATVAHEAADRCVKYWALIESAETGRLGRGGNEDDWRYCG